MNCDLNYYRVLGCRPDDSIDRIKTRYRTLIKEYHPDRQHGGKDNPSIIQLATRRFMEIKEAYEAIERSRSLEVASR